MGWISPLMKQCFVTAGVSLNMAEMGLVCGYGAPLLHQLKQPNSDIPIDDFSGSWLASLPGIFMFVGNLVIIPVMANFGRRSANLLSVCLLIASWLTIAFVPSIYLLLVARAIQGICLGMATNFCSLLIGEYTSPRHRGMLLMTMSVLISFAVLFVHVTGSLASWRMSATVCSAVALVNLVIVVFSPESPSWLASQGRYEESMKAFRWLRGDMEEDELKKIIEGSMAVTEEKVSLKTGDSKTILKKLEHDWTYFKVSIKKKEFYKPLLIMIHLYTIAMWGGVNLLAVYPRELLNKSSGSEINLPLAIVSLDVQRVITNSFAVFIIRKVRRRVMMFTTIGINIAALLATAGYSYAKEHYTIPYDHPMIGIFLIHCMMFAIAMGSLSLSLTIAGEIFPLEFKSLAGGISVLFYSLNLFLAVKTAPYCFATMGLHGMCALIALLIVYCLAVAGYLLPETKDRTLQEIEDEFRGKTLVANSEGTQA